MRVVRESIRIRAARPRVFRAYVEEIDVWWPRRGRYRYSFAPSRTEPAHIRFEPRAGGRLYETFADGSEYEIGRIALWEPPEQLSFSWRDPRWSSETTVLVTFTESGGETTVSVTHSGFDGQPTIVEGYAEGLVEILAALEGWVMRPDATQGESHGRDDRP